MDGWMDGWIGWLGWMDVGWLGGKVFLSNV